MFRLLKKIISKIRIEFKRRLIVKTKRNSKWFGNNYGGFYVCPDNLNSSSIIYSFGIGEDVSFDTSIIGEFKCEVFGFDPTPKSINWVHSQNLPSKFHFHQYGIDNKTRLVNFYLPKNPEFVSGSVLENLNIDTDTTIQVQMRTLEEIAGSLGHKKIDVLKMDIEGSEFKIPDSILNSELQINQILIEFHDRFFSDGKVMRKNAENILRSNGFEIFAISNSLEEVSFIRKS